MTNSENPPLPPLQGGGWGIPLTKRDIPPRRSRERRPGVWPLANWAALFAVLVGAALAYVGFQRIVTPPPVVQTLETPIRTVAASVPQGATETNSIGQQRVVRTPDGHLVALWASGAGLSLASDLGDHGRSWRAPITLPAIEAFSLSAAIAESGSIQLGFVDGEGAGFAALTRDPAGWQSTNIVRLGTTTSPIVDVAWDQANGLAYVVWVADAQKIQWASIDVDRRGIAELQGSGELARASAGDALVNVATGPESQVVATYRKGDTAGWFSRSLTDPAGDWRAEEALPTKIDARAGSVAVDRRGVAHLILIDQAGDELLYFKRSGKGWLNSVTAIPSGTTETMDDPFLATDATSKLLYAFFSTTGTADALRVAVNDPATGWEDPYRISVEDNSTQGYAPTSLDPLTGTPSVLWTSAGSSPSIQSGNIVLP